MPNTFLSEISINPTNAAILARWQALALPHAWLVAGCLFQTVWNLRSGKAPDADIKDYDIFYFDPDDLSERGEQQAQARADALYKDLGVHVEVANQARVHLWYPGHFGRPCPALVSAEDGIRRFLVLETCVAVRPHEVHAPNGLDGMYQGRLTPNPLTPFPELFARKVVSYQSRWPWLSVSRT
ncbi:nucleotidyltransferase family protein [Hydrogenophaga flava]|uniref:nucleotidyltransferase family protein n=1 Tax=Hydrogenophaga flava TaxID=65657 RepID=UPI000825CD68|nr:nucleotidyltransferase family protein [Hydrogenophaga flava]